MSGHETAAPSAKGELMSTTRISILSAVTLGALVVAAPRLAHAGGSCSSTWEKASKIFQRTKPLLGKAACTLLEKTGAIEDAEKCITEFEKDVAAIDAAIKTYNQDATSEKIGPRGLGENRTYTGTLLAERLFVGEAVASDDLTFEFHGEGGKSKADFDVTVCFVDDKGDNVIAPKTKTFTDNDGSWKQTFTGVAYARPLVYLRNSKVTIDGHKYSLSIRRGDEPAMVSAARKKL